MKKIILLLVSFLISLSLISPAALAKSEQGKESLVALGDSIPYGYNLEEHNQRVSRDAFPFIIGEEVDMRVRNLGESGWTTVDLLEALEQDDKFKQSVRHADYVTLNIGSNDLLKLFKLYSVGKINETEFNVGVQGVLQNLSKVIQKVRSLTDATVITYNIYNPFQENDPSHDSGDVLLKGINKGIEVTISQLSVKGVDDIYLVDAYNAFGNNQEEYVMLGDIHPTENGHEVLADIALEVIKQ